MLEKDNTKVYVNGEFVLKKEASISVFDRGFLFSDAIYEVTAVIDKKLVSWEGHLNRLRYSLSELNIKFTYTDEELFSIHKKLIEKKIETIHNFYKKHLKSNLFLTKKIGHKSN